MAKTKVDELLEELENKAAPLPSVAAVPASNGKANGPMSPAAVAEIWSPASAGVRKTLEDLLIERGQVDANTVMQAKSVQQGARGKKLSQILLEMSAVQEDHVQKAVADLLKVPFVTADAKTFERKIYDLLPADFMKNKGCLPLEYDDNGRLTVGIVDPANVFLLDEVKAKTKAKSVKLVVVCQSNINAVVEHMNAGAEGTGEDYEKLLQEVSQEDLEVVEDEKEEVTDLAKASGESPVIRLVNHIIFDAIKQGASDIHLEPHEKRLVVRYRIDGVLFEAMNPPHQMQAPVMSRLKIMANLDISERRLPQDGRIRTVVHGRKVDLRVSTLPVQYGEKTVIRILDNRSISLGLEQLGFSEDCLTILKKQIERPNGIILVTGPTGSGKTTTLYSAIRCMDGAKMNISTVEDPVEYHLGFANQVQVHEKIGMTFAAALKSLLRQDPDVIMLGEIRDAETAHIAVQAALTGHLVLSTLHTNDAPSSITRLINIGVEPYLISAACNAVLAQRLIRRICSGCKEKMVLADDEMKEFLTTHGFDPNNVFHGKGCPKCRNTGYSGRVGIYEMLVLDDVARDLVVKNPNVTDLRRICKERGMVTLREDGLHKVSLGQTTVEEVLSATENVI